jgi:membrane-associated phospholipid phosphatase
MSGIDSIDWAILRWLNGYAVRFPELDSLMSQVVQVRSLGFLFMTMVLCYFWFQDSSHSPEVRSRILMTIVSGLVALAVSRLLSAALPFRPRPFSVSGEQLRPLSDVSGVIRTWSSFPSDHAAMAFALSTGVWTFVPWAGALAFLVAIVFISFPRVFVGLHYPSDVISGALIGIIVTLSMQAPRIRARVAPFLLGLERRYSGAFYVTLFAIMYEITRMFDDLRRPVSMLFDVLH